MSAEILRRAAALMRERAEVAEPGPWSIDEGLDGRREVLGPIKRVPGKTEQVILSDTVNRPNAEHIASWHPDVALAAAELLDESAHDEDTVQEMPEGLFLLLVEFARVYLGAASC